MRIFLPLFIPYLLVLGAVILLVFRSPQPWRDRRFIPVASRLVGYSGLILALFFALFGILSFIIELQVDQAIFLILSGAVLGIWAIFRVVMFAVGDVTRSLNPTKKDIQP